MPQRKHNPGKGQNTNGESDSACDHGGYRSGFANAHSMKPCGGAPGTIETDANQWTSGADADGAITAGVGIGICELLVCAEFIGF